LFKSIKLGHVIGDWTEIALPALGHVAIFWFIYSDTDILKTRKCSEPFELRWLWYRKMLMFSNISTLLNV